MKSGQIWKCPSDPIDRSQVPMDRTVGFFGNSPSPNVLFSSYMSNYNVLKASNQTTTTNLAAFENTAERIALGEVNGNPGAYPAVTGPADVAK